MATAEGALKALAEPNRMEILRLTKDGARSAGEIASHFDITMQAVSQHLRVLREAGLLTEERVGTKRLYAMKPEGLETIRQFVEELWPDRLQRLKKLAETKAKHGRRG